MPNIVDLKTLREIRSAVLEEVRETLKHAEWSIDNVLIVERVIKTMHDKKLDSRYKKFQTTELGFNKRGEKLK